MSNSMGLLEPKDLTRIIQRPRRQLISIYQEGKAAYEQATNFPLKLPLDLVSVLRLCAPGPLNRKVFEFLRLGILLQQMELLSETPGKAVVVNGEEIECGVWQQDYLEGKRRLQRGGGDEQARSTRSVQLRMSSVVDQFLEMRIPFQQGRRVTKNGLICAFVASSLDFARRNPQVQLTIEDSEASADDLERYANFLDDLYPSAPASKE